MQARVKRNFLVLSLVFFLTATFYWNEYELDVSHAYKRDCPGATAQDLAVPMSTRGFARLCCDVYPNVFGKYTPQNTYGFSFSDSVLRMILPWRVKRSFFEAGVQSDPRYFARHKQWSSEVVYVVTPDLSSFLRVFLLLPADSRITLVTGSEDIGAPWEIFHPNRSGYFDYNQAALWPRGQPMTMYEFIADPRLVVWYAQNYDLLGCNHYTCSAVDAMKDAHIVSKVRPLPIGLDMHSLSEKQRGATLGSIWHQLCSQRQDLAVARELSTDKFQQKVIAVHAEFDCAFESSKGRELRLLTRGQLCELLFLARRRGDKRFIFDGSSNNGSVVRGKLSSNRGTKQNFWRRLAVNAFSLAPPGFGVDTHRTWEILQMHTVPIVISSTLDALYSEFPIVIIRDWREVFELGSLERFKRDIETRFGFEPFTSAVLDKMTTSYWVNQVRNASRLT